MSESMQGLHRTHRCTEVSNANIGETVTVMGWVQKRRNLGSLIFVDLRDRSGLLQIVFDEPQIGTAGFEKAGSLRSEYVIAVVGTETSRSLRRIFGFYRSLKHRRSTSRRTARRTRRRD